MAESECEALLFEPGGTRNTGDVEDELKTAREEPALYRVIRKTSGMTRTFPPSTAARGRYSLCHA